MAAFPAAQTTAELQDNNSTNASLSVTQHCYQRAADKSHPQKPSFPQATQLPAPATISTYKTSRTCPSTFSSNNTAISISPTSTATGNLPSETTHTLASTFTTANPVSSHHTFRDSPQPATGFTADPNHYPPHNKTLNARACGACRRHNPPHFFTSTFTSQKQNHPHPLQHHSPQRSTKSHRHQHKRSATHRYQRQSYQHFSHEQRYVTRGA